MGYLGWIESHAKKIASAVPLKAQPEIGDIFPAATFKILEGKQDRTYLQLEDDTRQIELAALPTENLAVLIFNTLCSGCVDNIRFINRHLKSLPETNLRVIAIASGNDPHKTRRFRHREKIHFPLFSDVDRKLFQQLGLTYMPVLYLLKKQAEGYYIIVGKKAGILDKDDAIVKLLTPAGALQKP